jgi:catechol 2,3-dioxygenase
VIWRLGHVELTVDDLDRAEEFYVGLLGFDRHDRAGGSLYLRAANEFDAWSLCLTESDGKGVGHIAFRTSSEEHLDELEALHERLGLPTERVPAGTEPHQGQALRVRTPDGHPVEFFHSFDEIQVVDGDAVRLPMRASHMRPGVPPAQIDHVNLRVPDTPTAMEYWTDQLDFQPSELWLEPDGSTRTAWLRRTTGTHDVALGRGDAALHHVAYTVAQDSALLRAADLMADAGLEARIEYGPSRHGATNAFCLYLRDPAGNRVELYTGDYNRDLDRPPVRWSAEEYARHGHSWWGLTPGESFRRDTSPLRTSRWPEPAPALSPSS